MNSRGKMTMRVDFETVLELDVSPARRGKIALRIATRMQGTVGASNEVTGHLDPVLARALADELREAADLAEIRRDGRAQDPRRKP